jgi:hypothetical protein
MTLSGFCVVRKGSLAVIAVVCTTFDENLKVIAREERETSVLHLFPFICPNSIKVRLDACDLISRLVC